MSSTFHDSIQDAKRLRELAEETAKRRIVREHMPEVRRRLDEMFSSLSEQQITAIETGELGPDAFPYEGEEVVADATGDAIEELSGPELPEPAVTPTDLGDVEPALVEEVPEAPVDSVVVPDAPSVPEPAPVTQPSGLGALLDLDAVEAEVERELAVSPPDEMAPVERARAEAEAAITDEPEVDTEIEVEEDVESAYAEDDEIEIEFVDAPEEEPGDEDEDDSVVYVEPGITSESASKKPSETADNNATVRLVSGLERIEKSYTKLAEGNGDDAAGLLRSVAAAQATLRENETYRDNLRRALVGQSIHPSIFAALHEASLRIDEGLRRALSEIRGTEVEMERPEPALPAQFPETGPEPADLGVEGSHEEEGDSSDSDEGDRTIEVEVEVKVPSFEAHRRDDSAIVVEIADADGAAEQFGGGSVATKRVFDNERHVGPMRAADVVWSDDVDDEELVCAVEFEADGTEDDPIVEVRTTRGGDTPTNTLKEDRFMSRRNRSKGNEVFEISYDELKAALRSSSLQEMDMPPEPKVDAGFGDMDEPLNLDDALDGVREDDAQDLEYTKTDKGMGWEDTTVNESRRARALRKRVRVLEAALRKERLATEKMRVASRLIRQRGLTNEQKRLIGQKIDEARSIRELKLVYQTLKESLGLGTRKPVNERRTSPAASSRVTTPGSAPQRLDESNAIARWQKLAGINE